MSLVCLADPEELDEVAELDRLVLPGCPWKVEECDAVFVVRDVDDRVCAYATLRWSVRFDLVVFFDRAGVAPMARGRGLQRKLIRARLRWGAKHRATHAITYTSPENSQSSNNLIACGFRMYTPIKPWAGLGNCYWKRKC